MTSTKWLVLVTTVLSAGCAKEEPKGEPQSPREFLQDFYDWYVPLANVDAPEPAVNNVLRLRPMAIDSTLLRLLKTDSILRVSSPGEVVGIDWDPFLLSQDPCGHYSVGHETGDGNTREFEVVGNCGAASAKGPFTVTVGKQRGRWVIVTVGDSTGFDIRAGLAASQSDRR
jgi:hypothetical protein